MASGLIDKSKFYKTRSGEYLGKFRFVSPVPYEDEQQGMGSFRGRMYIFEGKDGAGFGVAVRESNIPKTFNINAPPLPDNVEETTKMGGKRSSRKASRKNNRRNTRRN